MIGRQNLRVLGIPIACRWQPIDKVGEVFQPWVTSDFGRSDNCLSGLRLMVLGESHHDDGPSFDHINKERFTEGTVRSLTINGNYRFFTNVLQTVTGVKKYTLSRTEIENFWRATLFYNYVPDMVDSRRQSEGGQSRCPTHESFLAGREPLQSVLGTYHPEIVLCCGKRLWNCLIPGLPGFAGNHWSYAYYDDGYRVFGLINHPSIGFSSTRWHQRYRQLSRFTTVPRSVRGYSCTDPSLP
ncbi:hypothetical protein MKI84_16825 [Ancylobacter sp. A5.8]|uniref:hypothetical protein n=1 Tax=Ancylobacter gelatini TaxID=2919920 RepID=UPI001F4DD6CD|nr:hypothetical protein [Ancylobacter gelatini]MCJ8144590.1 hypothetical protein [Ancylobacter gelatini]